MANSIITPIIYSSNRFSTTRVSKRASRLDNVSASVRASIKFMHYLFVQPLYTLVRSAVFGATRCVLSEHDGYAVNYLTLVPGRGNQHEGTVHHRSIV